MTRNEFVLVARDEGSIPGACPRAALPKAIPLFARTVTNRPRFTADTVPASACTSATAPKAPNESENHRRKSAMSRAHQGKPGVLCAVAIVLTSILD
jgi:hypothetical protein